MVFMSVLFYDVPDVVQMNIFFVLIPSPGGGIGRHKGLKIPRLQKRAGSSPAPGTTNSYSGYLFI